MKNSHIAVSAFLTYIKPLKRHNYTLYIILAHSPPSPESLQSIPVRVFLCTEQALVRSVGSQPDCSATSWLCDLGQVMQLFVPLLSSQSEGSNSTQFRVVVSLT